MARSRTVLKNVSSLSRDEYNTLVRMNMHNAGSMMSSIYVDRRRPHTENKVVIHYDEAGKIDGWAYVFPRERTWPTKAWFYVSPKSRRKGIGTRLANRVKKIDKKIATEPWDKRSASFFKKNNLLDSNHSWLLD